MADSRGGAPLSLLGRRLPATLQRRVLVLPPGRIRAYDEADWRDALVVVERGQVELRFATGARGFGRGNVVCLADLPLLAFENGGSEPAVVVGVSRRRAGPPSGGCRPPRSTRLRLT
jgi:hypothetical protein